MITEICRINQIDEGKKWEFLIVFSHSMINRKVAPPIIDALNFNFTLPPCNHTVSDNGLPIYWLHAGEQEVVEIDWVFPGGLWSQTKNAAAQAVAALLKNGTSTRTAFEINIIESYGSTLRVSVNNDFATVTLFSLVKHLPQLLPIIQEVIQQPAFPEQELQVYVQNAIQRLNINLMQSDFVANRHIDAMLFGPQHPYGKFTLAKDLKSLETVDLQQYHAQHFKAQTCKIFMAGKISVQDVALVQQYFGREAWGSSEIKPDPQHELQPAQEKTQRIINNENGVQAAVRLGRDFVTRTHPDFAPMVVLNTLFGGYFGSRLMANIREEKGYTYGIYSHLYPTRKAGALLIATEAGRDVSEQTIEEVFKEMKNLRDTPAPEEELLLVKNYLLGNLLGDLDGAFSILQRWKNLILNDLPESHFYKNVETYKTITADTVQELAQRYLKEEAFYNLVVV
jgi:zinc protease